MRTDLAPAATPVRLADYQPPAWAIETVRLEVDLAPHATRVRARIRFHRTPGGTRPDLRLDGRGLTLVSATLDGIAPGAALTQDREGLTVAGTAIPGDAFDWDCETEIDPAGNTALEGLYMSRGLYCTQCEAEGFRKITFYPDRPDVMAVFTVRITADAALPVLLSNGNPGAAGTLPDGRHFAEWHDPHPKPAYLFALVAGNLVAHRERFTTAGGREVALAIWVRPGDLDRCAYAMDALVRSMAWDERVYGREYDLDQFNIVAVDDFNMGAMENKGLNIFNSKYVLASPATATDMDYELIEAIIAHEYFHNWTGNRITCRDWFQLCLKEGLTVFRDQQFSADERGEACQRIDAVKTLRARQFREDGGPLAHPVRPEEYVEINNFYTATVYEKGAEVIRMLHTLVGADGYRAALDLYFARHDGQACTIEQFRQCFEDATGRDLTQFARWWSQAGTPRVSLHEEWDGQTFTLTLRQSTPPTPGQTTKAPLVIPVAVGLIGPNGGPALVEQVLVLDQAEQSWTFAGLGARPVVSALRGFSAPVILDHPQADPGFLLAHDSDPFARWEAGRTTALTLARALVAGATDIPASWTQAMGRVLADDSLDPAFRAMVLEVPGDDEIARDIAGTGALVDPDAVHAAGRALRRALATALDGPLKAAWAAHAVPGPYDPGAEAAGRRALRARCLSLLVAGGSPEAMALAEAAFDGADNMSESLPALTALVHAGAPGAAARLAAFHDRWQHDPLVIDKWLSLQASAPLPGTLAAVQALTGHPAFDWKNPNKFRALIGTFAMGNPVGFHRADGAGYEFIVDWLLRLDPVNPQTTARVAGCAETWARHDLPRQGRIRAAFARLLAAPDLSRNTREIVSRVFGG